MEIQNEFDGIIEAGDDTSLEIERKRNQDKQSETTKVTTCAAASRNAILALFLAARKILC